MNLLAGVVLLLGVFYALVILYFWIGLFRLEQGEGTETPRVSVLVPARDEEANIERCLRSLARQTYPQERFEVLVIDDRSVDDTARITEHFIADKPHFRLLRYTNDGKKPTYKKQALEYGIRQARGELIFTIDADTVAQPEWIERMVRQYDAHTGLVAGIITFDPASEQTLFHRLQTLEFAGIVLCGMGSVGNGNPLICNGSNLSYRREAFEAVGGYRGHDHLPSGDDDLLLQNIHRKTSWQVRYSLDPRTINYTHPVKDLAGFLNQRSRWASKSLHYPDRSILLVLVLIYLFYLAVVLGLPLGLIGWLPLRVYLGALLLKWVPEFLLLFTGLKYFGRRDLLRWFPLAEWLQPPYILLVGLRGLLKKFTWKERKA